VRHRNIAILGLCQVVESEIQAAGDVQISSHETHSVKRRQQRDRFDEVLARIGNLSIFQVFCRSVSEIYN
jgi:hypothetical protein